MSLIKCSECGKEISDHAGACPSCGNPINIKPVIGEENSKPVEIELTSKRWKKKIIIGICLLLFVPIVMIQSIALGYLLLFMILIYAIYVRVGAWWTNG